MNDILTSVDKELLEAYHDDELSEFEIKRAQKLIDTNPAARDFVLALDEVREATRISEEEAWTRIEAPSADDVVARALADQPELDLEQLAPLLERFFDGETTEEESEFVADLIDTRDDVSDYVMTLEGLQAGVRASLEHAVQPDFSNFWDGVSERLDESADYEHSEHGMLLQRFHDGEVSDDEVASVNAWVDQSTPEVVGTLDALRELKLAVNAGIEEAQEGVNFASIWDRVESEIDTDVESQGENIVALGRKRREKKEESFFQQYKQGIVGAVAAVFMVASFIGFFGEEVLGPNEVRVVEKTVVIVDSVEYSEGSSVMVNSPVQEASAIATPESNSDDDATVIWLLDSDDDEAAPTPEASPDSENPESKPDAGFRGQPI